MGLASQSTASTHAKRIATWCNSSRYTQVVTMTLPRLEYTAATRMVLNYAVTTEHTTYRNSKPTCSGCFLLRTAVSKTHPHSTCQLEGSSVGPCGAIFVLLDPQVFIIFARGGSIKRVICGSSKGRNMHKAKFPCSCRSNNQGLATTRTNLWPHPPAHTIW